MCQVLPPTQKKKHQQKESMYRSETKYSETQSYQSFLGQLTPFIMIEGGLSRNSSRALHGARTLKNHGT